MEIPINEYEMGEVERLITLGYHQTDAAEMRSDMVRMVLEGIERIVRNAKERRTRNNFEYAPRPTTKPHPIE